MAFRQNEAAVRRDRLHLRPRYQDSKDGQNDKNGKKHRVDSNGNADVHVQQNKRPHQNRKDRRAHGRRRVQSLEEVVAGGDNDSDHDPDKATERDTRAPSHLGTFTVTVARLNPDHRRH